VGGDHPLFVPPTGCPNENSKFSPFGLTMTTSSVVADECFVSFEATHRAI
jgi:hypothetical protein